MSSSNEDKHKAAGTDKSLSPVQGKAEATATKKDQPAPEPEQAEAQPRPVPAAVTPAAVQADAEKARAEQTGEEPLHAEVDEAVVRTRGAKEIADEPTVQFDISEFLDKYPFQPMGPGNWGFRFGQEQDAEVRYFSDEYSSAKARAAADARQEGVDTLYLVKSSTVA